jgi:hypothetical protein
VLAVLDGGDGREASTAPIRALMMMSALGSAASSHRPSMPASTFMPSSFSSSFAAFGSNMHTRSTLNLRTISATFATLLFAATA